MNLVRRFALPVVIALSLILMAGFLLRMNDLVTREAPLGFLSLELCGSAERTARIFTSWGVITPWSPLHPDVQQPSTDVAATAGTWILASIPFALIYGAALFLLCRHLAVLSSSREAALLMSWCAWLAAFADLVALAAITRMFAGKSPDHATAQLAQGATFAKIILLAATLSWVTSEWWKQRRLSQSVN